MAEKSPLNVEQNSPSPKQRASFDDGLSSSVVQSGIGESSHRDFSNRIYLHMGKDVTTYYIPAYFSVLFKKFRQFDFANGTLDVSMTLVLRVYVEHLNEEERGAIRMIKLRINEDEAVMLDSEKGELKEIEGFFVFTIRTTRTIDFFPNIESFPYDIQCLKIKFELTSKSVTFYKDKSNSGLSAIDLKGKGKEKDKPGRTSIFRFNCHSTNEEGAMHAFKFGRDAKNDDVDRITELNLAYGKIHCELPPERKKPGQEEYFPVVEISIPLYREPEYVLMSSTVPLFILNLITMCIFAVDHDEYLGRLTILTVILLSLFAFLPSYRRYIPIPTITYLDYALFVSLFVIVLVVIDSFVAAVAMYNFRSSIALIAVASASMFFMYGYLLVRYYSFLILRKDLIVRPATKKKTSASFNNKNWSCKGLICPDDSEDLTETRGPVIRNYDY